MKIKMKYVVEDTDRHGNVRLYYRRSGQPKVWLRGPLGSPDFLADCKKAAAGPKKPKMAKRQKFGQPKKGSFRWLCGQYYASPMFRQLDPSTQKTRRAILEAFCVNKGDGDKPFAQMLPRYIRTRRDAKMDTPAAANTMEKVLRQVFKFAVDYDLHDSNAAAQVDYLKTNADRYHSWTLAEIEQFGETHPVGSMSRLAFALAL